MDQVKRTAWASAKNNGDFICVETCSGYRATATDPKGKQYLLPADVGDYELGVCVLEALASSRFISPSENPDEDFALFDLELTRDRYKAWVSHLMNSYGYKTKRALFRDMRHCNIESQEGIITIYPSYHRELEAWSGDGISEDSNVMIPSKSSATEVGAALKVAFGRCT